MVVMMVTGDGGDGSDRSDRSGSRPRRLASHTVEFYIVCVVCGDHCALAWPEVTLTAIPSTSAGKLTEDQIKAGYEALKQIDDLIKAGNTGRDLVDACSLFYTRIPHCCG